MVHGSFDLDKNPRSVIDGFGVKRFILPHQNAQGNYSQPFVIGVKVLAL